MFVLADAAPDAAAMAALTAMMGTVPLVTCALVVLFVWMFWRIFAKAGYSGALGLLCLIPYFGPLVCLIILAFGTWPNERPVTPAPTGTMPMTT